MGEIYFVRHGQASYGTSNYDRLSPLGHQQAEWLGAHLAESVGGFDQLVSGSLKRHRETLDGIRKTLKGDAPLMDDRLNEMSYFALETAYQKASGDSPPTTPEEGARTFAKVMEWWAADKIDDAAESYAAFRNRVLAALADHAKADVRVLIVSSGGPKGIAMQHVLGLGTKETTGLILSVFNASLTRFAVTDQGLRLMQFNTTPHLDHASRRHAHTFI